MKNRFAFTGVIFILLLLLTVSACSVPVRQSEASDYAGADSASAVSEESDDTESITAVSADCAAAESADEETITSSEAAISSETTAPSEESTGDIAPDSSDADTENPPVSRPSSLTAQSITTSDGLTLNYWLFTPENAVAGMPLVIYLHGGSGKGDDLEILMQNDGFPKYLKDGLLGEIPAYIAIPQLPSSKKGWTDIKNAVGDLVQSCCKTCGADSGRVSLTGHSMGGTGVWNLALALPETFSCIVPLSGSITTNESNIAALSDIPVWAFVGSADTIVSPDSSIKFITALKKNNPEAQITVLEAIDHFSVPKAVYLDEKLGILQWMISQTAE